MLARGQAGLLGTIATPCLLVIKLEMFARDQMELRAPA